MHARRQILLLLASRVKQSSSMLATTGAIDGLLGKGPLVGHGLTGLSAPSSLLAQSVSWLIGPHASASTSSQILPVAAAHALPVAAAHTASRTLPALRHYVTKQAHLQGQSGSIRGAERPGSQSWGPEGQFVSQRNWQNEVPPAATIPGALYEDAQGKQRLIMERIIKRGSASLDNAWRREAQTVVQEGVAGASTEATFVNTHDTAEAWQRQAVGNTAVETAPQGYASDIVEGATVVKTLVAAAPQSSNGSVEHPLKSPVQEVDQLPAVEVVPGAPKPRGRPKGSGKLPELKRKPRRSKEGVPVEGKVAEEKESGLGLEPAARAKSLGARANGEEFEAAGESLSVPQRRRGEKVAQGQGAIEAVAIGVAKSDGVSTAELFGLARGEAVGLARGKGVNEAAPVEGTHAAGAAEAVANVSSALLEVTPGARGATKPGLVQGGTFANGVAQSGGVTGKLKATSRVRGKGLKAESEEQERWKKERLEEERLKLEKGAAGTEVGVQKRVRIRSSKQPCPGKERTNTDGVQEGDCVSGEPALARVAKGFSQQRSKDGLPLRKSDIQETDRAVSEETVLRAASTGLPGLQAETEAVDAEGVIASEVREMGDSAGSGEVSPRGPVAITATAGEGTANAAQGVQSNGRSSDSATSRVSTGGQAPTSASSGMSALANGALSGECLSKTIGPSCPWSAGPLSKSGPSTSLSGATLAKTKAGPGPRKTPTMRTNASRRSVASKSAASKFVIAPPVDETLSEELEQTLVLAAKEGPVLFVDTLAEATRVAELAMTSHRDRVFACDTEVMQIDVKKEGPVGHGVMTCFTFYAGPDIDWGNGSSRVFVDVLDGEGGMERLEPFKAFFEDPTIKKVWHNYGFDRHILYNHGVDARGLYADTMHMARLFDSARDKTSGAGYSLESLTSDLKIMGKAATDASKTGMAKLFAKPNIKKDGTEGKLKVLPPVEELQTAPDTREAFIQYAAYDATATWQLWMALKAKLERTPWEGCVPGMKGTMWDCYERYLQPFGELLTDMERAGMLVDTDHLAKMEEVALLEQARAGERFRRWAAKRCPDASLMNVGSDIQIRQLLFGGKENYKDKSDSLPISRVFKVPNTDGYVEPERAGKAPRKQRDIVLTSLGVDLPVEIWTPSGWPAVSGAVLKSLAGKVAIDWATPEMEEDSEGSFEPTDTDGEDAATSDDDVSKYGTAYAAFGGGAQGKAACHAIAALIEVSAISTLLSGFIQPLQGDQMLGPDRRVHCSLNINTETGRLSARRPNLQNQPALEKDRYKIRKAFVAAPGNTLIVADYGQLELRLLAHLANCKSMKDAFKAGGDFHSRTALNMYKHVREAVDKREVLLEWDSKDGPPPAPMLKDVFGAERRKAKMLNFSIAYGKTAAGLSKDWKVSMDEAQDTVNLWYASRPEVLDWQKKQREIAHATTYVSTLLGRRRRLADINHDDRLKQSHMERAAINTPVQGSAADVAMLAMLEISRDARLAELGWTLLLQVHDEMILEGPEETADEALSLVVHDMAHPFDGRNVLEVDLAVDAKYAKSWYEAK